MTKKVLLAGAVDIGGTKVSVGLVNSSGEVMTKIFFSTPVVEGPCFCADTIGAALNRRANEEGYGDFSHLFEAYHEGDFKAVDLMTTMFYQLKAGLWNLMTVFRPEIVILDGGIMKQYFEFFKGALQGLLPKSWDFIDHYTLQAAQTQNDSALVGAANLILREAKFYE